MIQHLGLLMEASVCFKVLCGSVQHRPENLPLWQLRDSFHWDWRKRSCWTELRGMMLGCSQEEMTTRFSSQLWTRLFSDNTSHLTGSFNAITSRFLWCLAGLDRQKLGRRFSWFHLTWCRFHPFVHVEGRDIIFVCLNSAGHRLFFLFYWHAAFKKTQSNRPITRADIYHFSIVIFFPLFCPIAYNIYILY